MPTINPFASPRDDVWEPVPGWLVQLRTAGLWRWWTLPAALAVAAGGGLCTLGMVGNLLVLIELLRGAAVGSLGGLPALAAPHMLALALLALDGGALVAAGLAWWLERPLLAAGLSLAALLFVPGLRLLAAL